MSMAPRDCKHGKLARSCDLCEYEAEISRLKSDLEAARDVLAAIDGHDASFLLRKAEYLKGTDGEGWAIGELVERAVKARQALSPESEALTREEELATKLAKAREALESIAADHGQFARERAQNALGEMG
jgi:hypothetical protein